MFFHDVEKQMNDFSNISTNDYQRIYFPSSRIEEQVESFQRIFSKKDTVVFLMGLDFQMRFLVERFYKKNSNNAEPRAILVGWMNAHALNSLYSHGEYYSDLVFDISDFGPMASLDFPNGAGRVMCQSETRWFTMILRWLSCAEWVLYKSSGCRVSSWNTQN
jgi:hypothetical protein